MSAGRGAELAAIVAVAVVALSVGWMVARGGQVPVERSAVGLRGLVSWMRGQDAEIRYASFGTVAPGSVGLRVIPVLDTDLDAEFSRPEARRDWLMTGTERDLSRGVLIRKAALLPSLVVLPKWTRAVRHTGYAHESLLLPGADAAAAARAFDALPAPLLRPGGVLRFDAGGGYGGLLYEPQLFAPRLAAGCAPELSAGPGHLLIRCDRGGGPVWLLSDPDLINNHGLRLAGNADAAAQLLTRIAGGGPILIDTTNHIFTLADAPAVRRRGWADLARFFAWPHVLAWFGLGALTALLLWRSWVRFGPAQVLYDDRPGAARSVSIAAKARILRMAGNDPRLFAAHVENRLRRVERRLFGQAGSAEPAARIAEFVARTDPELAKGFKHAAAAAMTPGTGTPPAQLLTLLDGFEQQAERVLNGS
ncbi:hypothetical protein GE300_00585 [Rhodobacteraceae bacterium 2CG4]|uniref:DUF4350 domain-containing protein n=1 Tax=Halovulum marinum TaxID=2662447 RepID=A0A6L5YUZ6_9RHOB|nr:hypothetical protein [Halovulum marinum]MSU88108.1 hypothetical protein [Halovulum marinum]